MILFEEFVNSAVVSPFRPKLRQLIVPLRYFMMVISQHTAQLSWSLHIMVTSAFATAAQPKPRYSCGTTF